MLSLTPSQNHIVASAALSFIARLFMVAAAASGAGAAPSAATATVPGAGGRITYAVAARVRAELDAVIPELGPCPGGGRPLRRPSRTPPLPAGKTLVDRCLEAAVDAAPADLCSTASDAVLQAGPSLRGGCPEVSLPHPSPRPSPAQLLLAYGAATQPAVLACLHELPARLSPDAAAALTPAVVDGVVERMLRLAAAAAGAPRPAASPEAAVSGAWGHLYEQRRGAFQGRLPTPSIWQVFRRFMATLRGVCQGSDGLDALARVPSS